MRYDSMLKTLDRLKTAIDLKDATSASAEIAKLAGSGRAMY